MIEYTAPANTVERLLKRADVFNRKAEGLGLDVRADVTVSAPYEKEYTNEATGTRFVERVVDVTIPEVEIRLPGGWRFVAVIEHLDGANLVNRTPHIPEEELAIPAEYRTDAPTCDHCGLSRNRNSTIVVVNAEGEFKRVGTACSQGYLGIPSSKLVVLWNLVDELSGYDWGGHRGGEPSTPLLAFLAISAQVIRHYGFVSRSVARDDYTKTATADIVSDVAWSKATDADARAFPALTTGPDYYGAYQWAAPSEEDFDKAEAALAWLTEEVNPDANDYYWNLSVAARQGHVTVKRAGLVTSLISAYERATTARLEREAKETLPESTWVGQPKDKIAVEATVFYTDVREGYAYGTYEVFAILRDAEGHTFYISTATHTAFGGVLEAADRGDTLKFTATVKAHKTNGKGEQVTSLIRAKAI